MNFVALSGYVKRKFDVRKLENSQVINFSLAVKAKHATENKKYEYIQCVAWNGASDYIAKYINEGDYVDLEGVLATSSFIDKDGKTVYKTEVMVRDIQTPKKNDNSAQEQAVKEAVNDGYVDVKMTTSGDVTRAIGIADDDLPF